MSDTKREINPEELAWVFAMAQKYSDLRLIGAELDELHERIGAMTDAALGNKSIQPRSVSDLLKLMSAGILLKSDVARKLDIKPIEERKAMSLRESLQTNGAVNNA